jgi:hypothetical protein
MQVLTVQCVTLIICLNLFINNYNRNPTTQADTAPSTHKYYIPSVRNALHTQHTMHSLSITTNAPRTLSRCIILCTITKQLRHTNDIAYREYVEENIHNEISCIFTSPTTQK